MKNLWKSMISFALVVAFAFTTCSGVILASVKAISEMDTPVAKIQNDTYVPFSQRDKEAQSAYALAQRLESMGGSANVYANKEAYEREQSRKYASVNKTSASEASFQPVKQTITVMTTATGSKENGNYVPSVPLPNAVVRVDGVPRYTDRNGQIRVTLNREYAELFVEKNNYNPYIEFMDVTGDEKVIHMKKQSDDIDVYGAMLSIVDEHYNLLTQNYNIATDYMDFDSNLTLLSNVTPDLSMLYVNGQLDRIVSGNGFIYFDYNDYKAGDKFSIQVSYNGILSKEYPLNLNVIDLESSVDKLVTDEAINIAETVAGEKKNQSATNPSISVPSDQDFGIMGDFNFDFMDLVNFIKAQLLSSAKNIMTPKKMKNFLNGTWAPKISATFDASKGVIKFMVGISYSRDKVTGQVNEYNKLCDVLNSTKPQIDNLKSLYKSLESETKSLFESRPPVHDGGYEMAMNDAKRKQEMVQNSLGENISDAVRQEAVKSLKARNNECVQDMKKASDDTKEQIAKHETQKETEAKLGKLNNIQKNAKKTFSKFKGMVDFEFEFYGVFGLSVVTGKFTECQVVAGFAVKVSFTKQFVVWVIPVYIKVMVSGQLRITLNIIEYGELQIKDIDSLMRAIIFDINLYLRGDVGVGLYDVASVGGYLNFNFDFHLPIDGAYPDAEDHAYGEFKISVGVRAKLLLLEYKHEWDLYEDLIFGTKDAKAMAISQRNLYAQQYLSDNELFSSVYQECKPQLIDMGNGKSMLIWLADSAERDTYNRTELNYAICKDGVWGESHTVTEDTGLADFYPNAYYDGKDVHLTWQRSNKAFNESDNIVSMAKAGEIYYSRFDVNKEQFVGTRAITDNEEMDCAPKFALKEKNTDPLTIVWQKNSANDLLGINGTNSVDYSELNSSSWSQENKIYASENIIAHLSSATKSGKLTISLIEDTDKNAITDGDRKVIVITDKNAKELDAGVVANTEFAVMDSNITLFYSSNNNIVYTSDYSNFSIAAKSDSQEFFLGFHVVSNKNGTAILYESNGDTGKQAYAVLRDNLTNVWSKNISLADEAYNVSAPDGFIDENGSLQLAYILTTDDDRASLCYAEKTFNYGIEITSVFAVDKIETNKESELGITVKNTGDFAYDRLSLELFGQTIEVDLQALLNADEERLIYIKLTPQTLNGKTEIIKITGYMGSRMGASFEYEYTWNFTDLSLSFTMKLVNGKQVFHVTIANESNIATEYNFIVYCEGKMSYNQSGALKANGSKEFDFSIENIKAGDYVYMNVEAAEAEDSIYNNACSYYSIQDELIEIEKVNPYREAMDIARGL